MPEKIGRIANVFVKVSLGKRRWNKNAGRFCYLYQKLKTCHLDVKLHIRFIAFWNFWYTLFSVDCLADIAKNQVTAVHIWCFKSSRLQNKFRTRFLCNVSLTSLTNCTQCLIRNMLNYVNQVEVLIPKYMLISIKFFLYP